MTNDDVTIGGTTIKDSGERRVFATGAHRDRAVGKGAFNQLPFAALLEVAQVFEAGAIKYTANNWKLGMPLSEYANSGIRHAVKAAQGWDDENHAAMAAWNFLCLIETRAMIARGQLPAELNDIQNWLTDAGVERAMVFVREQNEKRLAAQQQQQQQQAA